MVGAVSVDIHVHPSLELSESRSAHTWLETHRNARKPPVRCRRQNWAL